MVKVRNLSIAIAGVACVAIGSTVAPSAAQAAIITNNFRVDVTTGSLANQSFFGNFSYNDAALSDSNIQLIDTGNGNQIINHTNGLISLSFNFLGGTYTEKSDIGYDDVGLNNFPQLNFKDGLFQALDYIVSESYKPSIPIPDPIDSFRTIYDSAAGKTYFQAYGVGNPFALNTPVLATGTVTYGVQAVPTPALLPGLIGFGVSVLRKRRAMAKEETVES